NKAAARSGDQPISSAHAGKSVRPSTARISSSWRSNSARSSQMAGNDNSGQPSVEIPHDRWPLLTGAIIDLQSDDCFQWLPMQERAQIFQRELTGITPPVARWSAEVRKQRDVRQPAQGRIRRQRLLLENIQRHLQASFPRNAE